MYFVFVLYYNFVLYLYDGERRMFVIVLFIFKTCPGRGEIGARPLPGVIIKTRAEGGHLPN